MSYLFLTLFPFVVILIVNTFFQSLLKAYPDYPITTAQAVIPLWLVLINTWSIKIFGFNYWAFIFFSLSLALIIDLRRFRLRQSQFTLYHYFKHASHLVFVFLTAQLISFIILGWFNRYL